ncbi:MAG: PASTA domain-containing protein [candidate division WOR-3 bacterium]
MPHLRTGFWGCLLSTAVGAAAALFFGVLLINLVLLPWRVKLGREAVVPNVVGMNRDEAESELKSQGFSVGDARYVADSQFAVGKVVETRPRAGSRVKLGRVVELDISAGQEQTTVPPVTGLPLRRAQAAIENADLKVGLIESASSAALPEGQVISTVPPPGTMLRKGNSVKLVVSLGTPGLEMPRVRGMALTLAKEVLADAGLVIGSITEQVSPEPEGTVLAQEPLPGSDVQIGQSVRLVVARAVPPPPGARRKVGLRESSKGAGAPRTRVRSKSDAPLKSSK